MPAPLRLPNNIMHPTRSRVIDSGSKALGRVMMSVQQTMRDIAKAILDAAKGLLGLADQLKAADRQQRAVLTNLFDKISACLAATSSEIRAGEIPYGRYGELIEMRSCRLQAE